MNTPYALLLFVVVVLLILIGWGLYVQFSEPPAPATTQPATQPLVERLRAERERRMQERERLELPIPATATAPSL
jgi:hypothetical protein